MFDAGSITVGLSLGLVVAAAATGLALRRFDPRSPVTGFGIGFGFAAMFCTVGAYLGLMA